MEDNQQIKNWNAGIEFNKIIYEWTERFSEAHLYKEWASSIDILDNMLSFTKSKILAEADIKGDKAKVQETIKVTESRIKSVMDFIQLKKNSVKYDYICRKNLKFIRDNIWQLQGDYGVLYPFEEKRKKRDPGNAVSDFA